MNKVLLFIFLCPFMSFAKNAELSKPQFVQRLQANLPDMFCSSDQFFSQCFKVDNKTCKTKIALFTETCLDKLDYMVSDKIIGEKEIKEAGTKIGACVGMAFTKKFEKKKINSKKCKDDGEWIKDSD